METSAAVEHVVRTVLAQLGPSAAASAAPTTSVPVEKKSTPVAAPNPKVWTWRGRLLTLADLPASIRGKSSVEVSKTAVITPAVKDRLKELGIKIQQIQHTVPSSTSVGMALAVGQAGPCEFAEQLLKMVSREVGLERFPLTTMADQVEQLTAKVQAGQLGLLLAGVPALGVCLANRQQGIRAVTAKDVSELKQLQAELQPNVLVLAAKGNPLFPLKRMIVEFVQGGMQACPAKWQKWLG